MNEKNEKNKSKSKESKIAEAVKELQEHQSHTTETQQETKKKEKASKEESEEQKTEWQKQYKKGEECHKRVCFQVWQEKEILKKEVEKIKRLHVKEIFSRFYIMKQNVAMWMNCYGQDIMKEIFGQMKGEMEAINRGDFKTLKDDKGNDIECFDCKKPVATWPGLENKSSDGNNYCFGCYSNKYPKEWKEKLVAYQEAETKKKQATRNEKNENLSENRKLIELKLNGVVVRSFYTTKKEESYKVSDARISWDDNKYNLVLGTNTVVVDRDKVEGKDIEKSFLLEILENGKLYDSRRIAKSQVKTDKSTEEK